MRNYEIVLILIFHDAEARQKEVTKSLDAIFEKNGAKVAARHDRGKRSLGYIMQKHKFGHVYVYDAQIDPAKVADIVREIRLENEVLQVMVSHPVAKPADAPVKKQVMANAS